jgi:polysaccharide export outer membrane protein
MRARVRIRTSKGVGDLLALNLLPFVTFREDDLTACSTVRAGLAVGLLLAVASTAASQQPPATDPRTAPKATKTAPAAQSPTLPTGVTPPADYVIGAQDVLAVAFWRDKEMNADVTVRPDGKISLPLINELQAAGLTPEQLRASIAEAASKYIEDPTVSVVIKDIRSRNVYITGAVTKPSTYPLIGEMNVLQLIALAGGLLEWADSKNIVGIQTENGPAEVSQI